MDLTIVIVEDDHDIREYLCVILNGTEGIRVLSAFESAEQAIPYIELHDPDIVLMDIDLPGMNGIEAVTTIRTNNPEQTVLMLSVHADSEHLFDSLCAGAVGYLLKGINPTKLIASLRDAYDGGAPMSSEIARKLVQYFHPNEKKQVLTPRELEILQHLCNGENYKSIAGLLFISKNTVKVHIKNIYKKLHVTNRAELVSKAFKDKLIK